MDNLNIIRSPIFFLAGLVLILFPKKVYKFQIYLIEKLHIKYNAKKERKYRVPLGIILITISIVLFITSTANLKI